MQTGKLNRATLIGSAQVAVFRTHGIPRPTLKFMKGETVRGEQVMALGYGYGQVEPILRLAHVSNPAMAYESEPVESIIFDNGFVGGQSGSPVINSQGDVVTIATQSDEHSGWGRPTPELRKALKKFL